MDFPGGARWKKLPKFRDYQSEHRERKEQRPIGDARSDCRPENESGSMGRRPRGGGAALCGRSYFRHLQRKRLPAGRFREIRIGTLKGGRTYVCDGGKVMAQSRCASGRLPVPGGSARLDVFHVQMGHQFREIATLRVKTPMHTPEAGHIVTEAPPERQRATHVKRASVNAHVQTELQAATGFSFAPSRIGAGDKEYFRKYNVAHNADESSTMVRMCRAICGGRTHSDSD